MGLANMWAITIFARPRTLVQGTFCQAQDLHPRAHSASGLGIHCSLAQYIISLYMQT